MAPSRGPPVRRADWGIRLIRPRSPPAALPPRRGDAYHGWVSTSWQGQQEPEPQWSQPPFAPGYQEPEPAGYQNPQPTYPAPPPLLPEAVSGAVLVPNAKIPPPGAVESILRVISGLLWPLVIAVLIFGGGSWWWGFIFAIIAGAVLKQITGELKRRRVSSARVIVPPPDPGQDLR